jgi:DNA-binding MarR family transcriptional regulator
MERADLVENVIKLEQQVNRFLRQHSPEAWMNLSLTTAQLKSLFFIDNEGITNFTKLAAALGVTSSNVTGIVDRLVEQELVSRKENPEDRRVLLLSVTEKGKTLLSSLRESRVKQISEVLTHLSTEELSILARGLALLIKAAEVHRQKAARNDVENADQ